MAVSVLTREPPALRLLDPPPTPAAEPERQHRTRLWRTALFGGAFAAYFALGYRVVVTDHVVPGDGLSRLAHAYFVFHESPAKLTAIGFVWPPLMTMVFLPFAWITPLSTSLVALPLMSGIFGALLVLSLERLLGTLTVPIWARLPMVALFAVNPMILFYASNGMAEIVYLELLVLGVGAFVQWHVTDDSWYLTAAGVMLAIGVLVRYEVLLWALAIAVALPFMRGAYRHGRAGIEGLLVAFMTPIVFVIALWSLFNWMIEGSPLYWLQHESNETFTQSVKASHIQLGTVASDLLQLNWHLFALSVPVGLALLVTSALKRNMMALVLAGLVFLNAAATAVLTLHTETFHTFELRYNMRAMPLALIGVGWLFYVYSSRVLRGAVVIGAIALLLVAIPLTWRTMEHNDNQFDELAFTRALNTGQSQDGTVSFGIPIELDPQRQVASWLDNHNAGKHQILTDDAQAYDVMLFSGHPDRFLDRINLGDSAWTRRLDNPFGHVTYLLVSRTRVADLAALRYPKLLEQGLPGYTRVFANAQWFVYRVAQREPAAVAVSS